MKDKPQWLGWLEKTCGLEKGKEISPEALCSITQANKVRDLVHAGLMLDCVLPEWLKKAYAKAYMEHDHRRGGADTRVVKLLEKSGRIRIKGHVVCDYCQGHGTITNSYNSYTRPCWYCQNGKVTKYEWCS